MSFPGARPVQRCPKCGASSPPNAPMCATCGMPLAGAPAAPAAPTPANPPAPSVAPLTPIPSAPSVARPVPVAVTAHQPFIAVLLGVVFWWIPGLAHVYNRQWAKAGLYLGVQILPLLLLFATLGAARSARSAAWMGGAVGISWVVALGAGLLSVLDAMMVARRHQEGDFVGVWTFF